MKDYPRIHSIGTINIIHHQNFDYELHPFRTDFTGDSGVGKSILTDLLQLIIIGSTEYESSTNSQDDRPFNTLVLETSEKGDYGYTYLNVEVEKRTVLTNWVLHRKEIQTKAKHLLCKVAWILSKRLSSHSTNHSLLKIL